MTQFLLSALVRSMLLGLVGVVVLRPTARRSAASLHAVALATVLAMTALPLISLLAPSYSVPVEDAPAAIFYLSDASRWITRNYFVVDGGLTVPMDIYA